MKLILIMLAILHHVNGGSTQLKDHQSLVETTCKNTPNYQLCISTVHASPWSSTADVAGLGLIIVDAVRAKAEAAMSAIDELKKLNPDVTHALEKCRDAYNAVLRADVPEAVAGLEKGVPKFAEFGMDDVAFEAEICEGGFEEVAAESPLSGVNKDLHELTDVAIAIIRNLL